MSKINIRVKRTNITIGGYTVQFKMFISNSIEPKPAIVIFPPETPVGNGMDTKIISELFDSFLSANYSVVTFTFPPIAQSQVNIIDARNIGLNCLDIFLQEIIENHEKTISYLLVGGLSFGGVLALDITFRRPEINGFFAISIPLLYYNCLTSIHETYKDALFFNASGDKIFNPIAHGKFIENLNIKGVNTKSIIYPNKDHLFSDIDSNEIFNVIYEHIKTKLI